MRPTLRFYIPEGTYDWTRMEARFDIFGDIPPGRFEACRASITFYGEGTLWLDDLLLVPTTRR